MKLDMQTGLMSHVRYLASPNQDDRPDPGGIDLIVIHAISLPPGEFGGDWINDLFTNQLPADAHPYFAEIYQLKVSSHFLIDRRGEVTQYVPLHRRAWHAGVSCHKWREACNDFSVGIELEGDDTTPYEAIQYRRLHELVEEIRAAYPGIADDDVVGHCHIAPGRKTDPGEAFDWSSFRKKLRTGLET